MDSGAAQQPQEAAPGGDTRHQRSKLIDKIEMMGQDILSNAQESINTIEDMKVKMHEDKVSMMKAVEDLTDNELSVQNNIKKLEVENDKIKQ